MNGCRVVVSGGARGIGRAISEALAKSGARVAVLSRSEKAAVQASAALTPSQVGDHGEHHALVYSYMPRSVPTSAGFSELA
jgi:NAD(P)-dependent dehydrogenase (short-subunit alcohol dehydrogenase family)